MRLSKCVLSTLIEDLNPALYQEKAFCNLVLRYSIQKRGFKPSSFRSVLDHAGIEIFSVLILCNFFVLVNNLVECVCVCMLSQWPHDFHMNLKLFVLLEFLAQFGSQVYSQI